MLCGGSAGTDTNGRLPLPEEPGSEESVVPDAAEALHIRSTRKWAVKKDLSISTRGQNMRGEAGRLFPLPKNDRKTNRGRTHVRHSALNTLPETPGHVLNDFMRLDEERMSGNKSSPEGL